MSWGFSPLPAGGSPTSAGGALDAVEHAPAPVRPRPPQRRYHTLEITDPGSWPAAQPGNVGIPVLAGRTLVAATGQSPLPALTQILTSLPLLSLARPAYPRHGVRPLPPIVPPAELLQVTRPTSWGVPILAGKTLLAPVGPQVFPAVVAVTAVPAHTQQPPSRAPQRRLLSPPALPVPPLNLGALADLPSQPASRAPRRGRAEFAFPVSPLPSPVTEAQTRIPPRRPQLPWDLRQQVEEVRILDVPGGGEARAPQGRRGGRPADLDTFPLLTPAIAAVVVEGTGDHRRPWAPAPKGSAVLPPPDLLQVTFPTAGGVPVLAGRMVLAAVQVQAFPLLAGQGPAALDLAPEGRGRWRAPYVPRDAAVWPAGALVIGDAPEAGAGRPWAGLRGARPADPLTLPLLTAAPLFDRAPEGWTPRTLLAAARGPQGSAQTPDRQLLGVTFPTSWDVPVFPGRTILAPVAPQVFGGLLVPLLARQDIGTTWVPRPARRGPRPSDLPLWPILAPPPVLLTRVEGDRPEIRRRRAQRLELLVLAWGGLTPTLPVVPAIFRPGSPSWQFADGGGVWVFTEDGGLRWQPGDLQAPDEAAYTTLVWAFLPSRASWEF